MLRSIFWRPYSRLLIVGDNSDWSNDEDAKDLRNICGKIGISAHIIKRSYFNIPQAVHYTSQFSLIQEQIYYSQNRISVDYFHGKPDQQESFKRCFEALIKHREQIKRVRVSNKEMESLIKSSGIDPERVMRIPIGIDTDLFKPQTRSKKLEARSWLGIPQDAVVIGSFQKDGVGWGEGNEPKLIKGPDIFLEVISRLKPQIPNLWVLLSGPARGYIRNGLNEISVPYRHRLLGKASGVSALYDSLDLYLITSREEGGPKACLESMAKGVPLVTTAVGQCRDLVNSYRNAMMASVDDTLALEAMSLEVFRDKNLREKLINEGQETAKENSFDSQLNLWMEYLKPLIIS